MEQSRSSNESGSIIRFYLGKNRKILVAQEPVLRQQCALFRRLSEQTPRQRDVTFDRLRADIQRDEYGDLYLPAVDHDTFQRLLDFLYQGVVPDITEAWIMERKLYHLADIFGATELMNRLVDTLQAYQLETDQHFTIKEISAILPTLGGSSLWGYCTAGIACQLAWDLYDEIDHEDLNSLVDHYPQVAADILRIQLKHGKDITSRTVDYRRPMDSDRGFGICEFHVHSSGDVCLSRLQEEIVDDYGRPPQQGQLFLGHHPVVKIKTEDEGQLFLGRYPVDPRFKIEDVGQALGSHRIMRLTQRRRARGVRHALSGTSRDRRVTKLRNHARRR